MDAAIALLVRRPNLRHLVFHGAHTENLRLSRMADTRKHPNLRLWM